ncbi:MAG: sulfotransferase, partial [Polyangiaceae bacterium]|nr:sulfotransferase [Polyangiaceae bacterium]
FGSYLTVWGVFHRLMDYSQRLDERLFPELATQKVEAPVFIFANPRSGTTLLHRLMSLDDSNFVSMRLFESIFPSAVWQKGFSKLDDFDSARLGGTLRKMVDLFDDKVFGSRWEDVHKLGLREAEEDECLFVYNLLSPTTMLLVPFVEEVRSQLFFDDLPAATRGRVMDYYEGILKRLLLARGEGRRYLNKNVFSIPRTLTLHERFPDAKFVYLARHPYEVMPSFCNMFYSAWRTHSPEIAKDSPEVKALAQVGYDYYRYAHACRQMLPAENFRVVRYDDLVANPKATVESVYEWMGVEITPAFREKLENATRAQRSYERPLEHSLEEWGITREDVYRELAPVFEEFG